MNYGYFDEQRKEYVITNPATPAPWANYLGDPNYGAIISNNAGGYSFVKSGANGRILRYRFNDCDDPGRYIYIRDCADGDFWSASWQPVGKPLSEYKSECRHGTAYTTISAEYRGIASEALYYVPQGKTYEVWKLKVTNTTEENKKLGIFGYAEFTTDNNYSQDQVNLQYTQFITRTYYRDNRIDMTINERCREEYNGSKRANRFFGMAGADVVSYCGDKENFLGLYNGYGKPQALQDGKCNNVLNYNANPCGALHTEIELAPGETREILFALGQKEPEEAIEILDSYKDVKTATDNELAQLINYWHGKLANFQIDTPDANFNAMINTWNAFQCFTTFVWSRAASFSYCGERNGYGFRDTVQDIQGILHLDPEMAKKQIRLMLSGQVHNGAGLPLVTYDHNPGHEATPEEPEEYAKRIDHNTYRADDALWLFPTVKKYIAESGDIDFLDEVIPFANKDEGTVYEHLKRAISFSMNHMAAHGMPAGLSADWNDCIKMGAQGESTFVSFQLYWAMKIMRTFCEHKNDELYIKYLDTEAEKLYNNIHANCWDEDRFIRGIRDNGIKVGAKADPEANMWLNPQSWSVISGVATKEQAEAALESTWRELNTPYGAKLLSPSYNNHPFDGSVMILFNGGTKENGAIFSQSQGWLIFAEALMGHGNRAFEYFKETSPSYMNDKAEIRKIEPYAHGQFTESTESPFAGRSHVHWLTGTASTVMVGCVEGILGMRPDLNGLEINPSVPSDWKEFGIERTFRGKKLHIKVENPNGSQGGAREVWLNGEKLEGIYIPANAMLDENDVKVIM